LNIAQFDLKGIKLSDFEYEGLQFLDARAGNILDTERPGASFQTDRIEPTIEVPVSE
jgi:hypothetical protein